MLNKNKSPYVIEIEKRWRKSISSSFFN
jgi:hypothetical protein